MLFLLSFGACRCCGFFLLAPRLGHTYITMTPLRSPMPQLAQFSCRPAPQHPYAPFQPMREHAHPVPAYSCAYVCASAISCFYMFVVCTVCEHMCVFGFAGVHVPVLCVCLCVCGYSMCLGMCLHIYFVFVRVCLHVCILVKIRVFL